MSFLTAQWRKLILVNYEIDPKHLQEYVPFGTDLDLWGGKCFVSLVGFLFLDTKLKGIPIPFHRNFEEVNLRFYVKRKEGDSVKRGVVFIKEIVPKRALSVVANTVYGEHYVTRKMKHEWLESENELTVKYAWAEGNDWNSMHVRCDNSLIDTLEGSEEEFITEHYWGYARLRQTSTNEYEVIHPKWQCYKLNDYTIDVDFGKTYGAAFEFLNDQTPNSVMLAEGSEIAVASKRRLGKDN